MWKDEENNAYFVQSEAELYDEDRIKKIKVGSPERKTKVVIHPPKIDVPDRKKLKSESTLEKVKGILAETRAVRALDPPYDAKGFSYALTQPFEVLADPNAPADLKDIAWRVTQLQYEGESEEENYETLTEKYVSEMEPEEVKKFRKANDKAKKFIAANPPHFQHIVNHYDEATPAEKEHGMNWYEDLHHVASHIGKDTKTPMHTMAGLIANYSPQTHWAENMITASRVARTKKAVGGLVQPRDSEGYGRKVFASNQQKNAASRMLGGEHYNNILKGNKIRAFAHLIEHGTQTDHEHPAVTVDRHAYSVAIGKRLTDMQHMNAGLKGKRKYGEVAKHYQTAADVISNRDKTKVEPHQLQAITWLVRQRKNEAEDKGRQGKAARLYNSDWHDYVHTWHPKMKGRLPGTGYEKEEGDTPF